MPDGNPGIMILARDEARGNPRTAQFAPEIGGSPLAKKVTLMIRKSVTKLDAPQGCGRVPKDGRV